ncbi:hypothetical protein Unana1_01341 [Umbelopsis nana]
MLSVSDSDAGPLSAGGLEVGCSSADPFEAGPSTSDDTASPEILAMINMDDTEGLLAQVQSNPSVTVSDLTKEWSKGQAARYILATKERRPLYDYLSEAEQVQELVQTVQADMKRMCEQYMIKMSQAGQFQCLEEEGFDENWARFWPLVNAARIGTSYHPESHKFTCCYCGLPIDKKLQSEGTLKLANHGKSCINGSTLTAGWSMVEGHWRNYFPPAKSRANASYLVDQYRPILDTLINFKKAVGSEDGHLLTSWKQALERGVKKLSNVDFIILEMKRGILIEERRRYGSKARGVSFVFNALEGQMEFTEDLDGEFQGRLLCE